MTKDLQKSVRRLMNLLYAPTYTDLSSHPITSAVQRRVWLSGSSLLSFQVISFNGGDGRVCSYTTPGRLKSEATDLSTCSRCLQMEQRYKT